MEILKNIFKIIISILIPAIIIAVVIISIIHALRGVNILLACGIYGVLLIIWAIFVDKWIRWLEDKKWF